MNPSPSHLPNCFLLAAALFKNHEKDDIALADTFEAISNAVRTFFCVLNPVNLSEELTARLTDVQKTRFQDAVAVAAEDTATAVTLEDVHKASKLWRRQFGDRFPLGEKKKNDCQEKQTAASIAALHIGANSPKP